MRAPAETFVALFQHGGRGEACEKVPGLFSDQAGHGSRGEAGDCPLRIYGTAVIRHLFPWQLLPSGEKHRV
ncbi:MAG TPA: hypothetical protein VLB07_08165, partial [Woeseiaceae bacterium]|nr:hypothetical protein [Woeseiaceae bacterium]